MQVAPLCGPPRVPGGRCKLWTHTHCHRRGAKRTVGEDLISDRHTIAYEFVCDLCLPKEKAAAHRDKGQGAEGERCVDVDDGDKEAEKQDRVKVDGEDEKQKGNAGAGGEAGEGPEDTGDGDVANVTRAPLVNRRIRKWFSNQRAYYEGTLTKPFVQDGQLFYAVEYDDGGRGGGFSRN